MNDPWRLPTAAATRAADRCYRLPVLGLAPLPGALDDPESLLEALFGRYLPTSGGDRPAPPTRVVANGHGSARGVTAWAGNGSGTHQVWEPARGAGAGTRRGEEAVRAGVPGTGTGAWRGAESALAGSPGEKGWAATESGSAARGGSGRVPDAGNRRVEEPARAGSQEARAANPQARAGQPEAWAVAPEGRGTGPDVRAARPDVRDMWGEASETRGVASEAWAGAVSGGVRHPGAAEDDGRAIASERRAATSVPEAVGRSASPGASGGAHRRPPLAAGPDVVAGQSIGAPAVTRLGRGAARLAAVLRAEERAEARGETATHSGSLAHSETVAEAGSVDRPLPRTTHIDGLVTTVAEEVAGRLRDELEWEFQRTYGTGG